MKRLKWILSGGLCRGILLRPMAVVPWFILFFEFPSLVFSQDFWTEIPAPATSYTYSSTNRIVITPDDEIYIVADDSIHKSTDGGETWEFLMDGAEPPYFSPLYVSEVGKIYVGIGSGPTVESFVVKSSDGGQTWDSLPVPYQPGIYSLLETADNSILTGLVSADAILKSDEGGSSFSLVFGDTLGSFGVWNSLLQDVMGKIYAMQDYQTAVYVSTDNGETWDTLPMPAGTERLKGYYVSRNGKVFYSTETGSVLTPNDAGTALVEYTKVNLPALYVGAVICVREDGLLLMSNSDDIAASYDNGATWEMMDMSGMDTTSVFANIGILDMEVDSEGYIYVYGPRGLYKSRESIGGTINLKKQESGIPKGKIHLRRTEGGLRIRFRSSPDGYLRILDPLGRVLLRQDISGKMEYTWNGRDEKGLLLPFGMYIINAHQEGHDSSSRFTLF